MLIFPWDHKQKQTQDKKYVYKNIQPNRCATYLGAPTIENIGWALSFNDNAHPLQILGAAPPAAMIDASDYYAHRSAILQQTTCPTARTHYKNTIHCYETNSTGSEQKSGLLLNCAY